MIQLTRDQINIDGYIRRAMTPSVGGIVTFIGVVRDDGILSLELESYEEAALRELESIWNEAMKDFDIVSADIIHRTGKLVIGDTIVLIVVAAGHRKEAFRACEFIIDRLKETVPIWKKEETRDGSRWVPGEHG
jgi:molybdopterin synthase catalytic subunit